MSRSKTKYLKIENMDIKAKQIMRKVEIIIIQIMKCTKVTVLFNCL